jgi:ABC-type transporter Mla subunit MlaD
VDTLVAKASATVEQSSRQITEITTRANDILDSTKRQLAIVEEVVGDAAERAKVQMERVELVLDDTLSRAHETVAVVHDGIMRPLREVNGIAAGVRAALGSLARGNRPTVDRATSDEEMFI